MTASWKPAEGTLAPPARHLTVLRSLDVAVGETHGVTWDGSLVWCVDGPTSSLVGVDPSSGDISRRLTGFLADAGTAWDGRALWQIGGDRARKIDPGTGAVLQTLALPDDGVSGMSWADGKLWVGNHRGKHLLLVDAATGLVERRLESDCHVCGVSWTAGALWHCAWTVPAASPAGWAELRQLDPRTGAVLQRFRFPEFTSGLESDGQGAFWCGLNAGGRVLLVRPQAS